MNIKDYYNEETKVIAMPKREVDISPQGMGCLLYESMKANFGKVALIDIITGESDTYDTLLIRTVRTAIKLKKLGIKPGDVISIFSHNKIDSITVFLAAFLEGAVNASLDPVLPDEDLEHLIQQVSPKAFFVATYGEMRIEGICKKLGLKPKIVVFGESDRNLQYADFNCSQDDEDSFEPYITKSIQELCLLKFSSGSTGLPKAMGFSHKYYGYHTAAQSFKNAMTMGNLFWTVSILTVLNQIRHGNIFTYSSKFDPAAFWENIKTYRVSFIQMLPYVALECLENKPVDWDGELDTMAIVGSITTKENLIKLRTALPNTSVVYSYGMSETYLLMNFACPISYQKVTSVGSPLTGIIYKVVDPETEQNLGFHQQGELRVKSPYLLTSYYKRDSSSIWDEEGYLKTGDIVYYDEDFSFFVVGRLKDTFKYKAVHISPVKYEAILENHPDIKTAVLIGIPHDVEGAHIMAVVIPRKGSNITPKNVEDFYNDRVIDSARIRAGVRFMDEIPKTPSGKIARKKLENMFSLK